MHIRILICRYIGLLLLGCFSSFLNAEVFRIAAPHITSLVEKDGNGTYQRIFEEALSKTDIKVKQHFVPYKRALALFEQSSVDCVYSFTKVLEESLGENKVISSFPLGAFGYYMFTPKGQAPLTDAHQLLSKTVGGVTGHDSYYRHLLPKETVLFMTNSDDQNLTMLSLGRISALIAAIPDILPRVDELSYSPDHPLLFSYDRLTCHKTEPNQVFIDKISKQLRKLHEEGSYAKISGELYVPFDGNKW